MVAGKFQPHRHAKLFFRRHRFSIALGHRLNVHRAVGVHVPVCLHRIGPDTGGGGYDATGAVVSPLRLLERAEPVVIVRTEIEGDLVARVELVRVTSAGVIGPTEVDPVQDRVERFHEAERAIRHTGSHNHRENQHQQQVGAGLVRGFLGPHKELFYLIQHPPEVRAVYTEKMIIIQ